jgi:hypothetical protein
MPDKDANTIEDQVFYQHTKIIDRSAFGRDGIYWSVKKVPKWLTWQGYRDLFTYGRPQCSLAREAHCDKRVQRGMACLTECKEPRRVFEVALLRTGGRGDNVYI